MKGFNYSEYIQQVYTSLFYKVIMFVGIGASIFYLYYDIVNEMSVCEIAIDLIWLLISIIYIYDVYIHKKCKFMYFVLGIQISLIVFARIL